MREVVSWDEYYMGIARKVATRSKDPNTQVGCVIIDVHGDPVITGYNGFAPGVPENPTLWQRPTKYPRVIHAETNAIGRAAKAGKATGGGTLYSTAFPCLPCAKLIIAAGIVRVVADKLISGWVGDHEEAVDRFDESCILWEVWQPEDIPEDMLDE